MLVSYFLYDLGGVGGWGEGVSSQGLSSPGVLFYRGIDPMVH